MKIRPIIKVKEFTEYQMSVSGSNVFESWQKENDVEVIDVKVVTKTHDQYLVTYMERKK